MITPPISLVLTPQLVAHTGSRSPLDAWYLTSKALPKFVPMYHIQYRNNISYLVGQFIYMILGEK
jgi:hypothetical protein